MCSCIFFFNQNTAYDMRISDWSSDVCSSDLLGGASVGMAERLIDEALKYAMERKQFGQPIAEFQLIQAMLADSKTEAYAARCMVLDAARTRDAGHSVPMAAACCKYFASEKIGRATGRDRVSTYG